jgi:predicted house-cleaning noncanonical NTP pyrophosphatase (MazG superfamily)
MRTHVVHLYERVGNIANDFGRFSKNLFALDSFPIVGIVTDSSIDTPSRQVIVKELRLKPFEIVQNHFDLFIKKANQLKVSIQRVEFTDDITDDLEEEIKNALDTKDYEELFKLIKEVRDEHIDIFSVSFFYEGKSHRMTKYAVAEVLGESHEIPDIIMESPLSLIAGLKKFPPSDIC